MLGMLINDLVARMFSFSDGAIFKMRQSIVMIETPRDRGFGTGILLDEKTVITAAHNFEKTPARQAIVHHPLVGERAEVRLSRLFHQADLAILQLKTPISALPAEIELSPNLRRGYPLAMPSFVDGTKVLYDPNGISGAFRGCVIKKGFFIAEAVGNKKADVPAHRQEMMIMHLKSRPGDSGSGVFNEDGKLVSINVAGGNVYAASAISPKRFQTVVRQI